MKIFFGFRAGFRIMYRQSARERKKSFSGRRSCIEKQPRNLYFKVLRLFFYIYRPCGFSDHSPAVRYCLATYASWPL